MPDAQAGSRTIAGRGVWLALLAALFTSAGAALLWWQGERAQASQQQQALLRAQQRGLQLADALAGQAQGLLTGIDFALQQLRSEWTGDPARFDPLARRVLAALPDGAVSHVTVVAADGQTVYNSLNPADQVNVADRAHFIVHRDGQDRLHVGKAVLSRLSGRWTVIVNRPLLNDGQFAGTMNMSLSTDYVSRQMAGVSLGSKDVVAMVHDDGSFVARSRDHDRAMGRHLPSDRPFLIDRESGSGLFRVSGEIDGVPRVYAWRRLPPHGLVVAVGLAEHEALALLAAGRDRERLVSALLLVLALVAGAAITVLLWQGTRRAHALERSERRYRELLQTAPDAIFVTHEGCFSYLNPAALRLFGATDERQLLGQPVLDRVHPDGHAAVLARRARLVVDRQSVPPLIERYLRLDGSEIAVEVTAAPYADERGAGTQVIVRDITERQQAEQFRLEGVRLAAENRQIQEANRLKSEFLANMSHELRTPLNAIIGFADILRGQSPTLPLDKQQQYLGHIATSGRHLLRLINDVLDLSKIESGKFELAPEPLQLPVLVREVLGVLQGEAARKRLTLRTELDPALGELLLDPARLKQMIYNLLSNAIKFTAEGGLVTLRARPEGGERVRIEVEDNGIGIAADDLSRLFTRFQQVHTGLTKAHAGTGLGLALTRHMAELHGGMAGARSTPGVGSVFHLLLPQRVEPGTAAHPLAGLTGVGQGAAGVQPVVLVVEDDGADRHRLLQILHDAGCQVELAVNGEQALQCAAARRYDAITLDLLLPDRSGLEVLNQLRQGGLNRDVPVVVITMVTETSAMAGFAVSDVLRKPIRPDEVMSALRRATELTTANPRVLVVDDDAAACELMATTLRGLGFEAVCVADGREALDRLPALRPDAVILDLLLPRLNGFDFLHELRQQPGPHPPVFVWTSLQLGADDLQRLAQSAQAVVNKAQDGLDALVDELRVWRERQRPPTAPLIPIASTPPALSTAPTQEDPA